MCSVLWMHVLGFLIDQASLQQHTAQLMCMHVCHAGPTVADVAATNGKAAHKDEATWTQQDAQCLKSE